VDSARSAVAWARQNALLSDLSGRPIRWIVDDATRFVAREIRRGRRYDGVVLDPPTRGHAAGAGPWQLDEGLAVLLDGCAALATATDTFCLLTAHTTGVAPAALATELAAAFGRPVAAIEAGTMTLVAASGATLSLGAYARFGRSSPREADRR
jgi:23S rRNA (cytosine1962-C5)-methyltransferase